MKVVIKWTEIDRAMYENQQKKRVALKEQEMEGEEMTFAGKNPRFLKTVLCMRGYRTC